MTLVDEDARRIIREDLDQNLVVEAGAGTGKTSALIGRVLSILASGRARLPQIALVTFTEKASGEMKLRLRADLERARTAAEGEQRVLFETAIAELESAQIGTIHGFCADLLRERPVEAGVDPLFKVLDERESDALYASAFDRWFERQLEAPSEGVARVLRRRTKDLRDGHGPRKVLYDAGKTLIGQRDFDARWKRAPFQRREALDAMLERLAELARISKLAEHPDDWLAQSMAHIERTWEEIERRERVTETRDYDGAEQIVRNSLRGWQGRYWGYKGSPRVKYSASISREEVSAKRDSTKAFIEETLLASDAELAALLQEELTPLVTSYCELLTRTGKLDFLDLLVRARDLLVNSSAVARMTASKYRVVLCDEFQDTDPLQLEILLRVATGRSGACAYTDLLPEQGRIFFVGDPKQSIYRFRRADVTLYERVKAWVAANGGRVVTLSSNFRSVKTIADFTNAALSKSMLPNPRGSQATYAPISAVQEDIAGQPAVVALPVPAPYSPKTGKVSSYYVGLSFPDAAAAYVEWLVTQSGYKVREKDGTLVPVAPGHICILFRRFTSFGEDVTRPYVRSLEARRIRHVLVGGRSFHAREEVLALRNALLAIEWPDDEYSVFATLRGPFFALLDELLLSFRHVTKRSLHPLRPKPEALPDTLVPVQEALELLGKLHRGRNHRPIADTLSTFLESVRAHAGVAFWPAGEQALGNLLRVMELARKTDRKGTTSFRAFVLMLEREADEQGVSEAPVVEEGADGVRIMTVHRAKGLEFPIVILADPTCSLFYEQPSRFVDTGRKLWAGPLAGAMPLDLHERTAEVLDDDHAEAIRLVYVAATRARDMLVVPAVADEKVDGWLSPLYPALYPPPRRWRASTLAPNVPVFGDDATKERPAAARVGAEASVRPGLVHPEAGTHTVVFWDANVLALGKEEDVGVRQQRILAKDDSGAGVSQGESEHAAWQAARAQALALGAKTDLAVRTVTAWAEATLSSSVATAPEPATRVVVRESSRAARGPRLGTLIHAIFEHVPYDATPGAVLLLADALGRRYFATEAEVAAAAEAVSGALAHSFFARIRKADEVRREVVLSFTQAPVATEGGPSVVLEGVADLVFREKKQWTVVDFKSGESGGAAGAQYDLQLDIYKKAIATSLGLSPSDVAAVLLVV
ncbi:MAG: UvrD-helicase domain-containing protein [Polyangiaceae bacterium]